MRKIRKSVALIMALVMMLGVNIQVYGQGDALSETPVPANDWQEDPGVEYREPEEDASESGDLELQEELPEETGESEDSEQAEQSSESDREPLDYEESQAVPLEEGEGSAASNPSDREYAFAVANPGSESHKRWQDRSLIVGQVFRYDLYFAWYDGNSFSTVSTLEEGMGIGLIYEAAAPFSLYWDESGYHLEIAPTQTGTYCLDLEYTHPYTEMREVSTLTVEVVDDHYVFVIAEPGSDDYREWTDMTVEVGEEYLYDLQFARYQNGVYEIIPDSGFGGGLGINLQPWSPDQQFTVIWTLDDDDTYHFQLSVQPTKAGAHTIDLRYLHPVTGDQMEETRVLHAISREYAYVVAEPGSQDYRPWLDPVVRVGEEAWYSLRLARKINGVYQVDTETEWGIASQEYEHFTLAPEEGGYVLGVHPTQVGTFSHMLYYVHPLTGETVMDRLKLHVLEPSPSGDLFVVTAPNGAVTHWNEGDTGAVTVRYDGEFNPEQTLTVTARDEWTLWDPEGTLRRISDGPGGTVFAMVRPTLEQPCEFRSGSAAMAVHILLPANMATHFALYDEALADTPERLATLEDGSLKPGQESRIAVVATLHGRTTLLADPLDIVRLDPPANAYAEPGDRYFTILPVETGELTLGIERGRSQTVYVGAALPLTMFVMQSYEGQGYSVADGDHLITRTSMCFRDMKTHTIIEGINILVRSSDPSVIAVEPHETDDRVFFLKPVGYGAARIYLESDGYYCEVLLTVKDWPIQPVAIMAHPQMIGQSAHIEWGHHILPQIAFEGTTENPFILPCLSSYFIELPMSSSHLLSFLSADARITSSDPDIVEVIQDTVYRAYLNPVRPGVCTITYEEGPYRKEVVVRSEPDTLDQVGCIDPGFYTYYGSAHVRRDAVMLEDGLPIVMTLAHSPPNWTREMLDVERFEFSQPGVARVEVFDGDLFRLIPVGNGTASLTYTVPSGEEFQLQVSVNLPEPVWDFVVPDDTAESGYRLWLGEQAAVGNRLEREILFAEVTLSGDGSIHTAKLLPAPTDLEVTAQDRSAFDLVQRGTAWYVQGAPDEAGEYSLTITATPEEGYSTQTWVKHLYASQAVVVTQNTVAAINEAIRTAPVTEGYETVILLPTGYIPMDGDTPVLLNRPVTLRGQDTVLASDVAALCLTPGAKLQNLTIRFDDTSLYNGQTGLRARTSLPFAYLPSIDLEQLIGAILGNGMVILENCELDGGTRRNPCQYGIAMLGNGVTFQGANTIRNFSEVGWLLHSAPGPRRYLRGLTVEANKIGVKILDNGSTDPYFIRVTDSNFLDNVVNIESEFAVNFSNNYFGGGNDSDNITKSPQYMEPLQFSQTGAPVKRPNLHIEGAHLSYTELLNFEAQAPIDTSNFIEANEPVQIAVRELDSAGVGAADSSNVLLHWSFKPVAQAGEAPLFRPDAYIDEEFDLPPDSGIEQYQGVSFAHHGPLPMEGAQISVIKKTFFAEDTLYLYRLANGTLTACGEIENTEEEWYTFFLDGCSDYVITNVVVESAGGDDGDGEKPGPGDGDNEGSGSDGSDENSGNAGGGNPVDNGAGNNGGYANNPGNQPKGLADTTQEPVPTSNRRPDNTAPNEQANPTWMGGDLIFMREKQAVAYPPDTVRPLPYDFSRITASPNQATASRGISSNRYVDDATIRAAFDIPRDGQVVIDVGVKTVVSPLAFQLLGENAQLTLVLKGDGYQWRFSGEDLQAELGKTAFDADVHWKVNPGGKNAQLSFAQHAALSGNGELMLETAPLLY